MLNMRLNSYAQFSSQTSASDSISPSPGLKIEDPEEKTSSIQAHAKGKPFVQPCLPKTLSPNPKP